MRISAEQATFLELLKASLFDETPFFSRDTDWDKVFEISKSQGVVSLIEPVVPNEYRNKWKNITYQNMAHFAKTVYEQNRLISLFQENAISMVIFKGMAAAMYYPDPMRRTMGDIDFLVPQVEFDNSHKLMQANGYLYVYGNDRHNTYEKNGVEFELHRKISHPNYNDIERIIISGMNNLVEYKVNDLVFQGLPVYENGLVLIGHIMQHLKGSGVGFRQIIDWMMFVHRELDDNAWINHFQVFAKEAGLEKLAITITYLCQKWLGLPNNITWCDGADDELADHILERIFLDGNFGIKRSVSEGINHSIKKAGLFKHLQAMGMIHWKAAQKHKFLIPFAWLYQIFRYGLKGIIGVYHGDKIFRKEKPGMKIEEIWRRLE